MTTSKLLVNLQKIAIKMYFGKSTWLPNELNIEYVLKKQFLQIIESQLSHIVDTIHLSISESYYQSLK